MKEAKDIVKGSFTRYVETAIHRARRDYLKKEQKTVFIEETTDPELLYLETGEGAARDMVSMADVIGVSWEPEAIRTYLNAQSGDRMRKSLYGLTDLEIVIVFAKVFRQLTFKEIGKEMGEDWKKIAAVYSYACKKLKKGWNEHGI